MADQILAFLAVMTLMVAVGIALGLRTPSLPIDRFRFTQPPELALHSLALRDDMCPGAPLRVICAGPRDTSPRAGYGENVLSDLRLAHTEQAAELVGHFTQTQIEAIRSRRASIAACLETRRDRRYPPTI